MADLTTLLSKFLNDLYAGVFGSSVPIATIRLGNGAVATPSYSFANDTGVGWFRVSSGNIGFATAGVVQSLYAANLIQQGSGGRYDWASTADASGAAADTGLSRTAAATVAVGNGTQGDVSGTVAATTYKSGASTGVATFGPAAVASITVKGGIVTAIS